MGKEKDTTKAPPPPLTFLQLHALGVPEDDVYNPSREARMKAKPRNKRVRKQYKEKLEAMQASCAEADVEMEAVHTEDTGGAEGSEEESSEVF